MFPLFQSLRPLNTLYIIITCGVCHRRRDGLREAVTSFPERSYTPDDIATDEFSEGEIRVQLLCFCAEVIFPYCQVQRNEMGHTGDERERVGHSRRKIQTEKAIRFL